MDHEEMKEQFAMSYDTYADGLYRFCYLKVSSREVAEDITQESFTRYWQHLRLGKEVENERALLYRIARNLVIDWYRKRKSVSLDAITEAGVEFAHDAHIRAEDHAEFTKAITVINTLDEPTRDALLMRFVEGLAPKDIAEVTGESANVISVRITRGIQKVRDHLHLS